MASSFSSALRTLARVLVLPLALLVGLAGPAQAAQWTTEQLTVPATADGTPVSFSEQEIKAGRKIFNSSCGECHAGDAVIIETIHKSKGLEYDVVILVNEDKTSRSETRPAAKAAMQSGATANAGRPWARANPSFASSQHMAAASTAAAPASESPAAHPGKRIKPGMVIANASAKWRGVAWPSPAIMQPRLSSSSRRAASATG